MNFSYFEMLFTQHVLSGNDVLDSMISELWCDHKASIIYKSEIVGRMFASLGANDNHDLIVTNGCYGKEIDRIEIGSIDPECQYSIYLKEAVS